MSDDEETEMQYEEEEEGEDADDDEEEEEEDDDDDDDEGEERRNKRKKSSPVDWAQKVLSLTQQVLELARENSRLKEELKAARDSKASEQGAESNVYLSQVINTPGGRPLHEVPVPYRFGGIGPWPAARDINRKTHLPENQLEARRKTTITFQLRFKKDHSPAPETAINPSGIVQFKLEMMYQDDRTLVRVIDFNKRHVEKLFHPSPDVIKVANMSSGMVSWSIDRFNVSSCDTQPKRNRAFVFRVSPLDEQLLSSNPDLEVLTPPFSIRAKVTAPLPVDAAGRGRGGAARGRGRGRG